MAVDTVRGPVDAGALGFTLTHEHLRVRREELGVAFPHLFDADGELAAAVRHVRAAQALGVRTICDPTVMGIGPDVRLAAAVAAETNLHIVVATGVYTRDALPPYFMRHSIDDLADAFVHDVQVGMQGTSIKAGFFKCVTDLPGITRGVERVLRAVARAHRRTGRPIMTHSLPANGSGIAQADLFAQEGVDLSHVLIGHSGDTEDLTYLRTLAARGCFLGLDRYGTEAPTTAQRNAVAAALCAAGLAGQLLLSHDFSCISDKHEPSVLAATRPDWSLVHIPRDVLPALGAAGVSPAAIEALKAGNARRWLEPVAPY